MRSRFGVFVLVGVLALPFLTAAEKEELAGGGKNIVGFSLKDTAGREIGLADFKDKKALAVVFIGTECPVNNYYMLTLRKLHDEFAPQGVQFLGVNSNDQDTAERVAVHAKEHRLPFPILKDSDQSVADQFGAERTPEVFLLDKGRNVVYRGRIDDQYAVGIARPKPTRRDLAEAINEVLAGKPVSVARTDVSSCFIGREERKSKTAGAGEITYTKQVVRILQENCQDCHRPGEIGPFSLMTYDKAKAWADTIHEVVNDGRMPPWHADPRYGKFVNDRRLKKEDKETLLAWIDQGCPQGDEKDLPPAREFRSQDGWRIGKPDVIFTLDKEVTVPAHVPGGIPYKYIRIPTNFTEDKWVQACEAKAGNRAVVHHILVYVQTPKVPGAKREKTGILESEDLIGDEPLMGTFLVGTAPGDMPAIYRPGCAKKIPKGATLVLQMHYTPNGIEQTDRSSVGLIFAKEPPQHVERTRTIINKDFIFQKMSIPPGDGNFKIVSKHGETFSRDAVLIGYMPHMHLRGKSFEFNLIYPDGKSEILLSVPRFDFGWQSSYRLETPIKIPGGSKIVCTAHFDNSAQNPNNPDPTRRVRWGDQTWEEMMIGWVDYYYVDEKPN